MEKVEKVGQLLRRHLIDNIKSSVEENSNAFLISYSALSGSQMNDLRKDLKRLGAQMFVSRTRLARLALKEIEQEAFSNTLSGQTAFVWSNADAVTVSKLLVDFTKKNENVAVRGAVLDGDFLAGQDVKRLADLPSREVLLSQLLGTIVSPITTLAGHLNAKSRDLLSILKQLSEKKGGS